MTIRATSTLCAALVFASACANDGPIPTPTDDPQALCQLDAGPARWLEEGESLSVTLRCASGATLAGDAVDPGALPAGASYDAASATLSWTPGLDQAAVYTLQFSLPGETASLLIGVADRFDDPSNAPLLDPARYTEEFGLPVLHLSTAPNLNANDYTPAELVYRGKHYFLDAKLRGASSLGYPKRSMTLKFRNEDRFQEPAYDFVHKRKVTLTTTFDDNSYLRQRLAFTLWNLLDPAHLQVQNYSAVLFLNGEYFGLYNVTDHIDRFFAESQGLYEGGNLYKAVNHDGNFSLTSSQTGQAKPTLHAGYEKKEGQDESDFSDLDALVSFVATSSPEEFRAQLDTLIDRRDFEDWYIFVSFIQADDSAGKNSYLYHDGRGGLWRYAPWDFNDSFGQTWQTARKGFQRNPSSYTSANFLFARLLADAQFGPALRQRYVDVLNGPYHLATLLALIDQLGTELAPSARRDERLWGEQYRSYHGWSFRNDYLSFDQELAYVRGWLSDRWFFLDASL